MQKQYSIAEAKNKLPAIIHDVEEGSIVQFTRRGRPVAVCHWAITNVFQSRKKDSGQLSRRFVPICGNIKIS